MDVKQTTGGIGQAPTDPPPPTNTIKRNYKCVVPREQQYSRYVAFGTNIPHTTDEDNVWSRVSMTYSGFKLLTRCNCVDPHIMLPTLQTKSSIKKKLQLSSSPTAKAAPMVDPIFTCTPFF
jgi:hypothetical protein